MSLIEKIDQGCGLHVDSVRKIRKYHLSQTDAVPKVMKGVDPNDRCECPRAPTFMQRIFGGAPQTKTETKNEL